MAFAFYYITLAALSLLAQGLPTKNISVQVPDGFSTHGKNNLFCVPTKWFQILVFFGVNYVSHAATVKPRPGQSQLHTARDVILALLFPYSGLLRALETIKRYSLKSQDELTKAARASALCVVVRTPQWDASSFPHTLTSLSKQSTSETSNKKPTHQLPTLLSSAASPKTDQEKAEPADTIQPEHSRSEVSEELNAVPVPRRDDLRVANSEEKGQSRREDLTKDKNEVKDQPAKGISALFSLRSPFKAFSHWLYEYLRQGHMNYRNINGICMLPTGYALSFLPSNAEVVSDLSNEGKEYVISSSKSMPRAIIAIVQVLYGSITLYRARGDQIESFGYAAFGLTVVPYVIMSIMNLIAALLMPDYPTFHVVRSYEHDEAIMLGGQIDGAVGRVVHTKDDSKYSQANAVIHNKVHTDIKARDDSNTEDTAKKQQSSGKVRTIQHVGPLRANDLLTHSRFTPYKLRGENSWSTPTIFVLLLIATFVCGAIHVGIIAGVTGFDNGRSTTAQRVWTMMWLVFNALVGPAVEYVSDTNNIHDEDDDDDKDSPKWLSTISHQVGSVLILAFIVWYGAAAIGGFVVVGQMIQAYGSCTLVQGLIA